MDIFWHSIEFRIHPTWYVIRDKVDICNWKVVDNHFNVYLFLIIESNLYFATCRQIQVHLLTFALGMWREDFSQRKRNQRKKCWLRIRPLVEIWYLIKWISSEMIVTTKLNRNFGSICWKTTTELETATHRSNCFSISKYLPKKFDEKWSKNSNERESSSNTGIHTSKLIQNDGNSKLKCFVHSSGKDE